MICGCVMEQQQPPPTEQNGTQANEPNPNQDGAKQPPVDPPPPASPVPARIRMRQPFKILIDIWGVLTSYKSRAELYRYIDDHLSEYLMANLDTPETKAFVVELVKRTMVDREKYPEMAIVGLDDCCDTPKTKVKSIVDNLQFRRKHKDTSLMVGMDILFNLIWTDGYRNKTLRPHVFTDVIPNFARWQADPFFIKMYSFASGPLENQKLFLSASTEGDVTKYLVSGFDAHSHYKYDWTKFRSILVSLSERIPSNLFYFTDSPTKGKQAAFAGMTVFVVLRDGNRKYRDEDLKPFRTINSFDQLDFIPFGP